MSAQPPIVTLARREAVLTGLGFALGFGWLWFPALQGFWLPEFLWGGLFDGGGASLFCTLLLAGFFSVWAAGGGMRMARRARPVHAAEGDKPAGARDAPGPEDFRACRLPHRAHAATLLLMAASLLPPAPVSGARLYLPVICMALAALIQGLFWGGAVLALPPRLAAAAFVVAAGVAALFGGLVSLAAPASGLARTALLLAAALAAWAAAYDLARALRLPRPEPRRARGRPAKTPEQPEGNDGAQAGEGATGRAALYAAGAAVMLLAFAATLAERMLSGPAFLDSPLAAGLLTALGAALGFILCGNGISPDNENQDSATFTPADPQGLFARMSFVSLHPATGICLALGLCGLAPALPEPFASPLAVAILNAGEGFVGAAAASALAGPFSLPPLRRAALALGAACILSNLGGVAAASLSRLFALPDALALSRVAAALTTAAALLLFAAYRRQARVKKRADAEPAPPPPEPDSAAVIFTAREREILGLIRQGLNNREIAETLRVQDVTVRFHLRNLYQKTGRTERAELAALDVESAL